MISPHQLSTTGPPRQILSHGSNTLEKNGAGNTFPSAYAAQQAHESHHYAPDNLMKPLLLRSIAGFASLLFLFAAATPLHAQTPTKIFVASYGNDANDGSRGSPKRNFQAAHSAVAAGGQIVVLDTAGYGQLNISKSLRVTVPPGVNGFITTSGGISGVNIVAGAGDTVALRGLIIEGNNSGGVGVNCASLGTLIVEDCTLRGFASGIAMDQNVAGRLRVRAASIDVGIYGVFLRATGAGALNALVVGCTIENCGFAALQTDATSTGTARLSAVDCVLTANNTVFSPGSNTVIYADNCRANGNTKVVDLSGGGQAFTLGNNAFTNNTAASDAFSGSVPER